MSSLNKSTIGAVCCRFSSGKNIASSEIKREGMYPVFGGNGIRGYTDTYNFDGECAVIGRQGAYCGNVRYFSGKAYMTEHAIVACAKAEYNTGYLAYKLSLMNLGQYQGQSAQPGLSVNTLAKVSIDMPALDSQNKIFECLKSIDDKIKNNTMICAELESMAKTIYDYWFLQFEFPNEDGKPYKSSGGKMVWNEELKREIPEGWKKAFLSDMIEIGNGKDHKELNDGNIPVYGSGGVMRKVDASIYEGESVLIPRKGTLNNIIYVNGAFWTVDTMFYTKMKKAHSAIFVYYSAKLYDFEKLNTGTGVPSMTSTIIYNLKVVMPPEEILEKFDNYVQALYLQIQKNKTENEELNSLRNFLLPLLMNGQVGFKD